MEKIEIYTDGASFPISRNGGYGIIIVAKEVEMYIYEGIKEGTNNQMELQAVIEGLKILKKRYEVVVYSDSSYVVENIRHNKIYEWRKTNYKRIKNAEQWKELIKLLKRQNVKFKKVKAHKDNEYNNKCHSLAYIAARDKLGRTQVYRKIGGKKNEE